MHWCGIACLVLGVAFLVPLCYRHSQNIRHTEALLSPAADILREQNDAFPQSVISVTPRIHVAMGYSLANSILVDTDEGWILIDTSESMETAHVVCQAFSAAIGFGKNNKTLHTVIYTHYHPDHCLGLKRF